MLTWVKPSSHHLRPFCAEHSTQAAVDAIYDGLLEDVRGCCNGSTTTAGSLLAFSSMPRSPPPSPTPIRMRSRESMLRVAPPSKTTLSITTIIVAVRKMSRCGPGKAEARAYAIAPRNPAKHSMCCWDRGIGG